MSKRVITVVQVVLSVTALLVVGSATVGTPANFSATFPPSDQSAA